MVSEKTFPCKYCKNGKIWVTEESHFHAGGPDGTQQPNTPCKPHWETCESCKGTGKVSGFLAHMQGYNVF
jgi:hypothetical protein